MFIEGVSTFLHFLEVTKKFWTFFQSFFFHNSCQKCNKNVLSFLDFFFGGGGSIMRGENIFIAFLHELWKNKTLKKNAQNIFVTPSAPPYPPPPPPTHTHTTTTTTTTTIPPLISIITLHASFLRSHAVSCKCLAVSWVVLWVSYGVLRCLAVISRTGY